MLPSSNEARQALRRGATEDEKVRLFVIEAARLLADRHCEDVLIFDVRGLSDLMDYVVLASGTSDRQIRALGGELEDLAGESGFERFGQDVDSAVTWLVIDFVDVVFHLFDPATRAHYDLEMMWDDAPRIDWKR